MRTKILLMIAALVMLSTFSCNKDSTPIEQSSIDLADDDAVTNLAFDDVFNTVDNASLILENLVGTGKGDFESGIVLTDQCPTTIISSGGFPKTITIDYGTGCTGFNGSTRSGKIVVIVTDKPAVVNARRTVTFDNYYFNGIKVEGTKVIKTLAPMNNQNRLVSIKLSNGKLTLANGKTIERAFEHQREWIAGSNTPMNMWDDEWLIRGTATGKNINGIVYKNTIMTAFHCKRACEFIISGTVKLERSGVDPVILDYGTGECDAKAVVTKGGESKEILLKHNHRSMWKVK
jgi:hypothetical protein